jgi:hypothetical protein
MSVWGCVLPATFCQPAAAAGFIYCRSQEWALHSPSPAGFVYLEFSWMLAPFVFSSIQPYLPVEIAGVPSLLSCGVCHFSCCWMPSPLQAHWGRWCHTCLLWPVCFFTVHVSECPSPTLWSSGHPTLFIFQLLVYYSVFFFFFPWAGSAVCPGGYADLSQGVPHATYLLTWCSASSKQVRNWHLVVWEPSWFL